MAPTPASTLMPDAPPAIIPNASSRSDGFSPGAIIGIVLAIVCLLLAVPLIAICLRRYEKTRLRETPKSPGSSSVSLRSIQEHQSLSSILVTKELSRSSMRMERVDSGIKRPDEVYGIRRERERGWSSLMEMRTSYRMHASNAADDTRFWHAIPETAVRTYLLGRSYQTASANNQGKQRSVVTVEGAGSAHAVDESVVRTICQS